MMKTLPFVLVLLIPLAPTIIAAPFTLSGGECIAGTSGPNCVRDWTVENGPGWTGHRAAWASVDAWRTRILCSSSCQRNGSGNQCQLMAVMHGIYSNPGDMVWLMLGGIWNDAAFSESPSDGGPFCISFHKAIGDAWQYNCAQEDADHMAGFFEYILDEFPIDPNAVALHGFSSGAIMTNHLMTTGCPVEKFVSVGAPYAAGFVLTPPTTKAAYIIAHGTHDNVVQYDETWNYNTGTVSLSCECNQFPGSGTCSLSTWMFLQGQRLAAATAKLRGYTGNVWDLDDPNTVIYPPLDLLNEDDSFCNSNYNQCINPLVSPNPWNANFDCSTLGVNETEVIEYPVTEGGKVQMLRMNLHNHDYPNKRRVDWGPTEYFLYLKNFIISNKGPHGLFGQRSTTRQAWRECYDPIWYFRSNPPELIFRNDTYYIPEDPNSIYFDVDDCESWCLNEKRCAEAFYYDYGSGRSCQMTVDENSLCNNVGSGWGTHIIATNEELGPTPVPSPSPTDGPEPSGSPNIGPCEPLSLCPICGQLLNDVLAGYACLDPNGVSIGDDNFGYTETDCNSNGIGYTWEPYDCYVADQALLYGDYSDEDRFYLKEAWQPKCCSDSQAPTTSPTISAPSPPFPCPVECAAPECFFAGTPGPDWWPPEWPGDPDGAPTEDGFCINYCNEYDPISSPGSRICGYTQWDPDGIDCSSCSTAVNAPPLPEEDRLPSSGLCSEIDDLAGHLVWGTGIRECNNGPEPTDNNRCTIYQGMNGDNIINPERTCENFCTHFGLSCLNGYDDGDNGCTYGGEGIGCFVSIWP